MTKIVELGKSSNGNDKVAIEIGTVTATKSKSSNGNKMFRLYGQHVIDGKIHYLSGYLTEKKA